MTSYGLLFHTACTSYGLLIRLFRVRTLRKALIIVVFLRVEHQLSAGGQEGAIAKTCLTIIPANIGGVKVVHLKLCLTRRWICTGKYLILLSIALQASNNTTLCRLKYPHQNTNTSFRSSIPHFTAYYQLFPDVWITC